MTDITTTSLPLLTGTRIPQVGLGACQTPRGDTHAAVTAALQGGYRHVVDGRQDATLLTTEHPVAADLGG